MSTPREPLRILLVEDSEDDRFFFEHAFSLSGCNALLFAANDGIEAIEFLRKEAAIPGRPKLPDLIFLDLKMPECDGFDVLRWMREHSLLERVKVFVLSGSSEPQDVALARDLGACDYLVKPLRVQRLRELLSVASVAPGSRGGP